MTMARTVRTPRTTAGKRMATIMLATAALTAGFVVQPARAALAATTPYPTAVLADAPIAYWRLGEPNGTSTLDASGRGRAGTLVGNVGLGAPGALAGDADTAATFDGTNARVTVPDAADLRLNGAFTIELWARLTRFVNTWPGLVLKGASSTANGYLIWYDATGSLHFKRNNIEIATPAGALPTTRFAHLAVVSTGTQVLWYVDGRLVTTANVSFPPNVGTSALEIGRGDQFGSDSIDEVALYDKALSAPQIANHQRVGVTTSPPPPPPPSDPVLLVAGDVACAVNDANFSGANPATCQARATAGLIRANAPATVAPLGDLVYGDGSLADFQGAYAPVWGSLGANVAVHPVPGNHDYRTEHELVTASSTAPGYYAYFAGIANPTGQLTATGQPVGWYSYDLGTWHIITLNHECAAVGGCAIGSPEEQWLTNDLASHPAACTIVMGHEPRWSDVADGPEFQALWQRLTAAKVAMLISGHHHNYQRFAARDVNGAIDANGVRQFVVGTGGASLHPFPTASSTAEARDSSHFGVLKLTLHAGRYDWQFLSTSGDAVDAGSAACPVATPPPPPTRYADAVRAAGPVAYWRLGEAAAQTTAADASGNGRVGTYTLGVNRPLAGALTNDADTAVGFNGSTGALNVADAAALRLNGAFTIELWAKLTTFANTWPGLVLKGDSSTANGYLVYYSNTGIVRLKRNGIEFSSTAGALTNTAWTHLAVTYDGVQARWYVNGTLNATRAVTFPANSGAAGLSLGRGDQFGAQSMDEVALYDKALDATTIAAHVAAGQT
jgi:Concanavalin A-like lectin/glucanases superfamily/Calcineurin-like phosphoesterase